VVEVDLSIRVFFGIVVYAVHQVNMCILFMYCGNESFVLLLNL